MDLVYDLIGEHRRQQEVIQELTEQLRQSRQRPEPVAAEVSESFNVDLKAEVPFHVQKDQAENDKMRSTMRSLTEALRESTLDRDRLRTAIDNQASVIQTYEHDMDALKRSLAEVKRKDGERREEALNMITAIQAVRSQQQYGEDGDSSMWQRKRAAAWKDAKMAEKLATDIVEVYEEKISALKHALELAQNGHRGPAKQSAASMTEAYIVFQGPGMRSDQAQTMYAEPRMRYAEPPIEKDMEIQVRFRFYWPVYFFFGIRN
jgi:chromosome segregation ATPase